MSIQCESPWERIAALETQAANAEKRAFDWSQKYGDALGRIDQLESKLAAYERDIEKFTVECVKAGIGDERSPEAAVALLAYQLAALQEDLIALDKDNDRLLDQVAALQAGPNALVLAEYINRMRVDFNSNGGFRIGDILAQAAAYLNGKHPAAPISAIPPGYVVVDWAQETDDPLAELDVIYAEYSQTFGKLPDADMAAAVRKVKEMLFGWWAWHRDTIRQALASAPAIQPQASTKPTDVPPGFYYDEELQAYVAAKPTTEPAPTTKESEDGK